MLRSRVGGHAHGNRERSAGRVDRISLYLLRHLACVTIPDRGGRVGESALGGMAPSRKEGMRWDWRA